MQRCSDCHAAVDDEAIFCDQCGYRLRAGPVAPAIIPAAFPRSFPVDVSPFQDVSGDACPACGYFNRPDEEFCANCGVQLISLALPRADSLPAAYPSVDAVGMLKLSSSAVQQGVEPTRNRICPTCGADNPPGENYCQICGFWLASQATSGGSVELDEVPQQALVGPPGLSPYETVSMANITGRLLSTTTNTSLALPPKTEIIIGRRDPERGIYPDVDLSAQGSSSNSVSRQHARMILQGNQLYIEDMKSTNATYLNRQRIQPGQLYLLNHGDELRLGGVALVYYSY